MQDSIGKVYDIRRKIDGKFIIESMYDLLKSLVIYFQEKIKKIKLLESRLLKTI